MRQGGPGCRRSVADFFTIAMGVQDIKRRGIRSVQSWILLAKPRSSRSSGRDATPGASTVA